jgi:hypothetical protein
MLAQGGAMRYVLAHQCDHEDHDGECGELSYLHEEADDATKKVVKVFDSEKDAKDFIRENRWSPDHIMVIPKREML